jgi:hypothetical protein
VAVVAVIAVVAGVALFRNWQQEQEYQTGHQAYLKADCAAAIGPLGNVAKDASDSSKNDTALKAKAELQECNAVVAADKLDSAGKPAEALVAYSAFVTKYAQSPLVDSVLAKGQKLTAGAPDRVAAVAVCDILETLETQRFLGQVDATLPPLLYGCGRAYAAAGSFADAFVAFARFRSDYPKHALAADVERAMAEAAIAETEASGAGKLPPPESVGKSGAEGGQVTVRIQNDSPDGMSIVFSGPDVRVEELAPCADCIKYVGAGPSACPEKGPVGEYVLAPGSYEVIVKSTSGSNVTPFRGTWNLKKAEKYAECFYVVSH